MSDPETETRKASEDLIHWQLDVAIEVGGAISVALKAERKPLVERIRDGSGIARRLWGAGAMKRSSGIPPLTVRTYSPRRTKWGVGADAFIKGKIRLHGMAAYIEMGLPTKRHKIEAKDGGRLAFVGRSGDVVHPEIVSHPGGPIRARPQLDRVATKLGTALEVGIRNRVKQLAAKWGF